MNNKPVAWMMVNRENTSAYLTFETPTRDMKISHEPYELYTHPVKELTINITEIKRTSDQSIQIVFTSCRSASEFVEILRKAQKK